MSNENHNSTHNWKSKLEELESFPGEAMLDNNLAWEKLHARLQGKNRERKPLWYWIAAAAVLFLFMIPIFISNKNNDQLSDTRSKQHQSETKQNLTKKDVPVKTENPNKHSFTAKNSAPLKKNLPVIFNKPNVTSQKNIAENKKDQLRLYDTVSTQNQITESTTDSLQIMESASRFAAITPAKKRLPVVHVNELDDPDYLPQVVRNSEKPSVHFLKLGSQEVYNGSASITKNFATINFKSSPN